MTESIAALQLSSTFRKEHPVSAHIGGLVIMHAASKPSGWLAVQACENALVTAFVSGGATTFPLPAVRLSESPRP